MELAGAPESGPVSEAPSEATESQHGDDEKDAERLREELKKVKAEVWKGCTIGMNPRVVVLSLPFFPLSAGDQHNGPFGELFTSWRNKQCVRSHLLAGRFEQSSLRFLKTWLCSEAQRVCHHLGVLWQQLKTFFHVSVLGPALPVSVSEAQSGLSFLPAFRKCCRKS